MMKKKDLGGVLAHAGEGGGGGGDWLNLKYAVRELEISEVTPNL